MKPSGSNLPRPVGDKTDDLESMVWIDRYIRLVDFLLTEEPQPSRGSEQQAG